MPDKRPRVLVADDYAPYVAAVSRLLAFDCELVGSVSDGSGVLDAARKCEPELLLLDVNLPTLNGFEVCQQVLAALPAIKVIMITGRFDDRVRERALRAGASACIPKHVDAAELLATITRVQQNGR